MNFIKPRVVTTPTQGLFIASGSPVTAELAGGAGFDWLILDMEHGLGDTGHLLQMLQALQGAAAAPLVRIPCPDSDLIQRALDQGAAGIVCPRIRSAAQAQAVVAALRYPPLGSRGMSGGIRAGGYGRTFADYFARANDELLVVVQIEDSAGLADVDAIAAVDGVDVLFLGHSDLSLSLGIPGRLDDPRILAAEDAVLAAARKHNKVAGMLVKDAAHAPAFRTRGFTFIGLGTDMGCLRRAFQGLLTQSVGG